MHNGREINIPFIQGNLLFVSYFIIYNTWSIIFLAFLVMMLTPFLFICHFNASAILFLTYSKLLCFLHFYITNQVQVKSFLFFRSIKSRGFKKNVDTKFLWYCLYGFGLPVVLTLILIFADLTRVLPEVITPHIGTINCFYNGQSQIL